jgi:hypothetical protein
MLAFLLTAAMLHPVHETVSEVEWNEKTNRLEVALRLDELDEQWLRKRADAVGNDSKWAIKYLRRNFRITEAKTGDDLKGAAATTDAPTTSDAGTANPTGSATYHWIGREEKGPFVWWYFEIEPVDHQRPRWIDVRLLWERNENYVNRILVLGHKPPRAIALTIQRPKAPFDNAAHEQPFSSQPDR